MFVLFWGYINDFLYILCTFFLPFSFLYTFISKKKIVIILKLFFPLSYFFFICMYLYMLLLFFSFI